MKTIIKNGRVYDGVNPEYSADILINDGIIEKIGQDLNETGAEIIDASGRLVLPGLVDMHCHLRDPGLEYKEDIVTGSRSAAAGGFTSIACMPNTKPVDDHKTVTSYIKYKAERNGFARVYPIGAITKGLEGKELAPMESMKAAGAVAVSDDGNPVSSSGMMRKALIYANMFELPVISHSEELSLSEDGSMNEGMTSTILGLKGIPASAEEVMVARDIMLAEETGTIIHIAHISTAGSARLVREAKARGVKVTCETCPHYFSLTDEECMGFNTLAKVSPPLRTAKDVAAIIAAIADGTVDAIATDHAPHHSDEKETGFAEAAKGLIGFETALAVAYECLVLPGHISLERLIELMGISPAAILGIEGGRLTEGGAADITIFDTEAKWSPSPENIVSKSKNSPYIGKTLIGRVVLTLLGGRTVYGG